MSGSSSTLAWNARCASQPACAAVPARTCRKRGKHVDAGRDEAARAMNFLTRNLLWKLVALAAAFGVWLNVCQ